VGYPRSGVKVTLAAGVEYTFSEEEFDFWNVRNVLEVEKETKPLPKKSVEKKTIKKSAKQSNNKAK